VIACGVARAAEFASVFQDARMARILAVVGALALALYSCQHVTQAPVIEPAAAVATEHSSTRDSAPEEFEPWPAFGVELAVLRSDTRARVPFATVDVVGSRDVDERAIVLAQVDGETLDGVFETHSRRLRADEAGRVRLPFGDPRSNGGLAVVGRADGLIGFCNVPASALEGELLLGDAREQVVKVVDPNGAPVPGITVIGGPFRRERDWRPLISSTTDADGCARFEAEPLCSVARADIQFRTSIVGASAASRVVDRSSFGTEDIEMVAPEFGSIEFVFTGDARVPSLMSVALQGSAVGPPTAPLAIARADGGSRMLERVALGREFGAVVVHLGGPAAEPFVVRGPTTAGERVVVEIATRPVLLEFQGRLVTSGGAPLVNEPIVVERAPSARTSPRTVALDVTTDADGRFFVTATLAPEGASDLRVVVPRTAQRSRPVHASLGEQQSANVVDLGDFTLADDAFAASLVVRRDGAAVPGLRFDVAVELAESDAPFGDLTQFRWFGLPPAAEGCRWSAARDLWSTSDADGRIELRCHALPGRIALVCSAFDVPLRGIAVGPFLNEVVIDLVP
jgi:hypothetical protein